MRAPVEFLPRTLLFYILSHAYLFRHWQRLWRGRRTAWAALPWFAVMGLFPYLYHLLPPGGMQDAFGRAGVCWLPAAFFFLVVFAVADACSLIAFLVRKKAPGALLLFFSRRRYLALLLCIAAGVYGYGVYEARSLRVTSLHLATEKLPPGAERLRIAFAADLHIGPQTGTAMLRNAVDAMLAQKPDLILLGGDLFDDAFQGTPADVRELRRLRAPLGVYAVLGNHDAFGGYVHAAAKLAGTGITLLSDQAADVGGICVIGLDDPDVAEQKGRARAEAAALLAASSCDRFTVLLDHRPGIHKDAVGLFDVQLSGHSHGGQIPLLKAFVESHYGTPTGFSAYRSPGGASVLFVTTGTGFSKLPIRLFVPPEIVVLNIARAGGAVTPR